MISHTFSLDVKMQKKSSNVWTIFFFKQKSDDGTKLASSGCIQHSKLSSICHISFCVRDFFLQNCWQYFNKKAIKQYNDCHDIVIGTVPLHEILLALIYGQMIGMLIGTILSSAFVRQKMSSVLRF